MVYGQDASNIEEGLENQSLAGPDHALLNVEKLAHTAGGLHLDSEKQDIGNQRR